MAWIKKNPHLLVLILVAVGVLAGSGLLVTQAKSFDAKFEGVRAPVTRGTKTPIQETKDIEEAQQEFQKPAVWNAPSKGNLPFVSIPYMLDKEGKLTTPDAGAFNSDSFTKQPIPNKWFIENKLAVLNPGISKQDADGDKFLNEDEFRANTDPQDPKSHPPYHSKLFLKQYIKVPFLLKFQAYDGDPKKDKPEDMKFQINALSLRQRTAFLGIGELVPNTKFKIEKFDFKMSTSTNGTEEDASELTLRNTESDTTVIVILGKVTDSPDSYALFQYLYTAPALDIRVKKLQEFVLQPETTLRYKLLDISQNEAQIQTPSGEKVTITALPPGYP